MVESENERIAAIRASSESGSACWDDPIGDARWLLDRLAEANATIARVRDLIDPASEMAATPYGSGAGRYFAEKDVRAAVGGER